jgi:arabinofuranosyltransferase
MSSRRIRSALWLKALLVLVLAAYLVVALRYAYRTSIVVDGQRFFTLWDDAMISMRYGRNFARGDGLVFNAGERVQGFSNLGLTVLMGVLHWLPLSPAHVPLAFQVLSAMGLVVIAILTARLTTSLASSVAAGLAAACALVIFAPLGIWTMQGAESGALAIVLLLASTFAQRALEAATTDARRRATKWLFVTLGMGIFLRFDFVSSYALFFGFGVMYLPERRRTLALGLVVGALTMGGVLLFGLGYYGDAMPNTYYLKATRIPVQAMVEQGWFHLMHAPYAILQGRMWGAVAMFAVGSIVLVRRRPIVWLLAITGLFHVVYFVRIGGDWVNMHLSRFLVPVVPLIIVVTIAGASELARRAGRVLTDAGPRRVRRFAAALLGVLAPVLAWCLSPGESLREWWLSGPTMYRNYNAKSVEVARYVAKFSAEDALIGVFWAGVMPYHCDRRMLDMLGRTDRHIARTEALPAPFYWPGHAKRDWNYVINERKPEIILSDTEEMRSRADYVFAYCSPHGPHYLAVRREKSTAWRDPLMKVRCTTIR